MAYDANSIQKLEFPSSVQMRVGMYLGKAAKNETSPGQMNVGVREILDNSVTEALRGKASHITLTFHKDGTISCLDNGRGIPVDINKETGKNGILMTMAELHSGGNFSGVEDGKAGAGLNGVGASCVNALSSRFDVEVFKGKFKHSLSFKEGIPGHYDSDGNFTESTKINKEKLAEDHEQGTNINFKFEPRFFTPQERIIVDDIIDRCRYTVYLVDGLKIDVVDETRSPEEGGGTYNFENVGGMAGMIDFISTGEPLLTSKDDDYTEKGIFTVKAIASYNTNAVIVENGKTINKEETRKIPIDVAFRFNADDKSELRSFANCIYNVRGGVHEDALKDALMDTFGKMTKDKDVNVDDVLEGLNACISVNVRDPQFDGQSKANLSGADVGKAIYSALIKELKKFTKNSLNDNQINIILKKIKDNSKARRAAEVAKITKKKSLSKNSSPANLPSKLKECDFPGDDLAELYICEGDSAAGTIIAARDSAFQAVLPVRGKVLNVMKTDFTKKKDVERFNANGEINDLIKALGAGVKEHFDIDKIRYGKIFLAADEDPDGQDICVLLTGVIYRLFKPMLEEGRVYKCCSPLFEIKYRKNGNDVEEYAITEQDRIDIEKRLKKQNVNYKVGRNKGLGELNADVFYQTVLNPETRRVIQVTMEDAEKADELLELAIGSESADSRKEWMINNFDVAESMGLTI